MREACQSAQQDSISSVCSSNPDEGESDHALIQAYRPICEVVYGPVGRPHSAGGCLIKGHDIPTMLQISHL